MILFLGGLLFICYFTDWQYRDDLMRLVMLLFGALNTLYAVGAASPRMCRLV